MELVRPRTTQVESNRILGSSKRPDGLLRVIELFKGVKVPRNEPIEFTTPKPASKARLTQETNEFLVDGHRTVTLVQVCHALPPMTIPEAHVNTWNSAVKDRLVDELRQCFRSERCRHPEFMMARDPSGKVGPCIIISVWDEALCGTEDGRRKTVRKATKTIRGLQTMKTCPFPFKVIADTLSLSSRLQESEQVVVWGSNPTGGDRRTAVSMEISAGTSTHQCFRLGGIIRVGSKLYGLTVA